MWKVLDVVVVILHSTWKVWESQTKQYLTDSNSNKLKHLKHSIATYPYLSFLERERERENKTKMQVVSACNNMWCMSVLPTTVPQKSISSVLSRREICISSSLCNHDALPPQQPISISTRYYIYHFFSSFKFKYVLIWF